MTNQITREQIIENVEAACGGEWGASRERIEQLQRDLIQALIWEQCPPACDEQYTGFYASANAWGAVARRQIAKLEAIATSEGNDPWPEPSIMDVILNHGESPQSLINAIRNKLASKTPWDIEAADEYIKYHTKEGK